MSKQARTTATDTKTVAERVREQITVVKQAVADLQNTDDFKRYLVTMSRFHSYSFNNQVLIWCQMAGATKVAGFQTWLKLKRNVKKGEKGLVILVPMSFKRQVKSVDADGIEQESTVMGTRFGVGHVFDVSQTEGEPLAKPPRVMLPDGEVDPLFERALVRICTDESLIVEHKLDATIEHGALGYYNKQANLIVLSPEINDATRLRVFVHEAAHHFAWHGSDETREQRESIAEAATFVVLSHFEIPQPEFSAPYLAQWASAGIIEGVAQQIQRVAGTLIERLEKQLGASAPKPAQEAA